MRQILFIVALSGAITLPVAADADTPILDELVITATRLPQPLGKTIADTTVLTEQDIRNSAAPDVLTLLRSLAGVEVAQTGGLGAQSSIFMRGTNSNQALVLLDGVRVNSATTGTTALEHIMLDDVERIEVVRGNVSSLYGSEAIGGVIQIFTRQGHGAPAASASAGIGSHGEQRAVAGYSGEVNDTSFSVNAGAVKTDGISALNPQLAPNANPNNNGYDNSTLDAQARHAFSPDHSLSASIFSTRGNASFDNAFGLPTDINTTTENIDKLSLATDDQFGSTWHSTVRLAQGTDDSHNYTNSVQTSRYQTRSNQLGWQNSLSIAEGQKVNLAAEHLGQAVASDTLYAQTSRNVNSLLAGYIGDYGAQQAQLNLRQDRYSDFGAANTGLLGYGLSFLDNWRATASVSNAFKAPTFNDMYYPLSFGYQGNPNLQPERSNNKEIGLHYAAHGQTVDAVYFDNRISDLIAINAAYTTVVNINQAHISGQELNYAGEFGRTRLKASATFQNPLDSATGLVLPRRAREFASIAATQDVDAWGIGAEMRLSGARQDADSNGNPITLPGYSLLNLTAHYNFNKHWNLSARADNLFDRNYSEVYAYNTLGRTLFVRLNYQQ